MFLKVGDRLIAIHHIQGIIRRPTGVYVFLGDSTPWEFKGSEAETLLAWAESTTVSPMLTLSEEVQSL